VPRIRSIYPEACRSRKLAALTPAGERCWWRLQCYLDDEGRSEDEPDIFASVLFQANHDVTAGMVDRWLWEMADAGLIVRFEVNEERFLEVVRWGDFQHPQRPKPSRIPPAHSVGTRRVRDEYATPPLPLAYGGEGMGVGEETDIGEGVGLDVPFREHAPVENPIAAGLVERSEQVATAYLANRTSE
jgi:hypothetical protein